MSDGLTESRREECAAERILDASEKLAEALEEVRDAAFGYSPLTFEIINDELARVGVQLVPLPGRR
jgi:hypothetical protein